MKDFIKFKVITPEKIVYQDEVSEITVPTASGEITVLPNHAPLVTLVRTGEIRVRKDSTKEQIPLSVSSGIMEIRESSPKNNLPTEIILLASRSELAADIDIDRAKQAYERAVKVMEEKKNENDVDFARFEALIEKEANRIKIYNKWHR